MADNWLVSDKVDLAHPASSYNPRVDVLMVPGDSKAHTWQVRVFNDNSTVDLAGGTVVGMFQRIDGNTVAVQGSVSGNVASVTLEPECYAIHGTLRAIMRYTVGNTTISLFEHMFTVRPDIDSGSIIDPSGETTMDVARLIADIDAAVASIPADYSALLNGAVRHDFAQALTNAQKTQARRNIDAGAVDLTLALESDNATDIPANSNFNDYLTPGNYKVRAISIAETIANIPYQASGRLTVARTTQSDRIIQVYWVNSTQIFIFYRFNSASWGEWSRLPNTNDINNTINAEADFYFYGRINRPTFAFRADYSIDVTIPANARVNYRDLSASPAQFKNGATTSVTAQTINVPHNKCLVYDISTNGISVENYNFNYNRNKAVLFYNSHGIVNGQWYRYYLLQQHEEQKNGYPAYFEQHVINRVDNANLLLVNPGTSGIVFITDHHYPNNDLKSVGLVEAVCRQTGINKIFLGGDYINRETSKAEALRNINRIAAMYEYPGKKTFRMCGNHEFNNPSASSDPDLAANELSAAELRNAIFSTFADDVDFDSGSLSYFYDDKINKIRYIVGSVTRSSSLDSASIKWVCDQLLLVPDDYSAVVMFHTILAYRNNETTPMISATNLLNTLDAFKNKSSYTFGGTTYDFSNSGADLICAICADMHVDTDYLTTGGVHVIATTTDSLQEEGGLTRTVGEISEVAFDIFLFDTVQRKIHCIRIGAGESREFSY